MRVAAIFYDVIPARMPENYPDAMLESLRAYWSGLADVDVALPISWTAAADMRWLMEERLGLRTPTIVPCPLAGDGGSAPRVTEARGVCPTTSRYGFSPWEPGNPEELPASSAPSWPRRSAPADRSS